MEAYKYLNTKNKLNCTILNNNFNKQCKLNTVIPNYIQINIKNKSNSARRAKINAQQIWFDEHMTFFLYTNKDT